MYSPIPSHGSDAHANTMCGRTDAETDRRRAIIEAEKLADVAVCGCLSTVCHLW